MPIRSRALAALAVAGVFGKRPREALFDLFGAGATDPYWLVQP
jgi:hypothetical protein